MLVSRPAKKCYHPARRIPQATTEDVIAEGKEMRLNAYDYKCMSIALR